MSDKKRIVVIIASLTIAVLLYKGSTYYYLHTVFRIHGNIVDEQGSPLDAEIDVTEGQLVSITESSFNTRFIKSRNGNFDIITSPCWNVSLDFGLQGYKNVTRSYASRRKIVNPLRIVMRRYVPSSSPVERSVVGEYLARSLDYKLYGRYNSVKLSLRIDHTATTITTLPDTNNTQVIGEGTWREEGNSVNGYILLSIKQPTGSPDPAKLSGDDLVLDAMDGGNRLMRHNGGSDFNRVK